MPEISAKTIQGFLLLLAVLFVIGAAVNYPLFAILVAAAAGGGFYLYKKKKNARDMV